MWENMDLLHSRLLQKTFFFSIAVLNIRYGFDAEKIWMRESTFNDKFPVSDSTFFARSRIHCGKSCTQHDTCTSFFYAPGQDWNCKLYDVVLSSADGLADVTEAAYYVLYNAESDSTIPPFTCPPDDTIFRTVLLSDGNAFTYKVVKTLVTQANAVQACSDQGAYLARVTTVPEMKMLLNLIINCTGYVDSNDYYVDGTNVVGGGGEDSPWLMSDEITPVPMSNDFWGDTFPNNPSSEHCLRMRAEVDFKWDDCPCSRMCYFICEK